MATRKRTKKSQPATTAQRLSSIIKSCRDIMRKDKGLNGDLDRLPMLTWILFLKFLDDMEEVHATEAEIAGSTYRPILDSPYRWRDWAAREDGITGDELIAFVNNDESVRPDGKRGPGLFAYLRSLEGTTRSDRRDVIRSVFQGTINRMVSGYLLRDVLNKVSEIHFASSEEIHTLSHLYESMLREMRDAAGDSGEFYTPRPLVHLIVEVMDPRLGEKILDPACGTGGFLVEAYHHLRKQCRTTKHVDTLQHQSLFGIEAKSLPYLLCQMNLTLHGLESPEIDPGNALRTPLNEIGDSDRVNVVMTNPPFGGEEERGILANFPEDKRTSETTLLFLQLIMRKLRRKGPAGRAAVVVQNGVLFGDGACARVKEELISRFNLHTIVRLPEGVFSPYTDIPTNILFFDAMGPTRETWFYEHPLPEGRKRYTKTKPLQLNELEDMTSWWSTRTEGPRAWHIDPRSLVERDERGSVVRLNLDMRNPNAARDVDDRTSKQIVADLIDLERTVISLLSDLHDVLATSDLRIERLGSRP